MNSPCGAAILLWMAVSSMLCLWAQPATPQLAEATAASDPVFRVSVPVVLLDAVVAQQRTSQPVGGLTAADFMLQENGEPQAITYFAQDELPLSIVFMFDLTFTVQPVLRTLGSAAQEILSHLKPQDEGAVAVFSSTATILQPFTTDREAAAAAIRQASGMTSGEATFLNESVYQVARETLKSSASNNRRAIICLTDGTVNTPSESMRKRWGKSVPEGQIHTEEEARRALLEAGASFNAIVERSTLSYLSVAAQHLDPAGSDNKRYPPGHVKDYAELAGGIVLNSSKKETVTKLGSLLSDLGSRYTLGYRPTRDLPAGAFCRIHLELTPEASARSGHPVVRTRSGYYR
jgi:VWFA-related protein